MRKKKEVYIPKTGITGVGDDYTVYILSRKERIVGFLIGFFAGVAAMQIMFGVWIVSIIAGLLIGKYVIPLYKKHLIKKRKKLMLTQFRDILDALSNSFAAGRNTPDAFADAYKDLSAMYGADTPMVKELEILIDGLHNNYVVEELLRDMADRCDLDDISSFAETFAVCNRLGGNLKKIVTDSKDIISDKIEVEMEIQTTVTAAKNEINIMAVMPFIVVAMMGTLGEDSITANTPLNVIVKLIALALFVVSYLVAQKITDIKV